MKQTGKFQFLIGTLKTGLKNTDFLNQSVVSIPHRHSKNELDDAI